MTRRADSILTLFTRNATRVPGHAERLQVEEMGAEGVVPPEERGLLACRSVHRVGVAGELAVVAGRVAEVPGTDEPPRGHRVGERAGDRRAEQRGGGPEARRRSQRRDPALERPPSRHDPVDPAGRGGRVVAPIELDVGDEPGGGAVVGRRAEEKRVDRAHPPAIGRRRRPAGQRLEARRGVPGRNRELVVRGAQRDPRPSRVVRRGRGGGRAGGAESDGRRAEPLRGREIVSERSLESPQRRLVAGRGAEHAGRHLRARDRRLLSARGRPHARQVAGPVHG